MWFSAKILFRSSVEKSDHGGLSEESIRVIAARNEEEALLKAESIGRREEHSYLNEDGQSVHWRFVKVMELQDLCEEKISDGMEIYSRIFEDHGLDDDDA